MSAITPVTLLAGRLGSGKSTLVNRLVAHPDFADTAVIVNEVGEVPVDHALSRVVRGPGIFQPGACLCCRASGETVAALREMHFQRAARSIPAYRRAIVEIAGQSDPAHMAAVLAELPLVAARYALSNIVTAIDARQDPGALDSDPRDVHAAALADLLVITHADRASPSALDALEARLATMNPRARILRAVRGAIDPHAFFAIPGLDRDGPTPTSKPSIPRKSCNPPSTETSSPSRS